MGCIEIVINSPINSRTEQINRNMGCIEMLLKNVSIVKKCGINRNMGCIEIAIDIVLLPFVNDKP